MKKGLIFLGLLSFILLFLTGCGEKNPKMRDMPKYDTSECYFGEGFQDHTDYCKYFYNENSIKKFETDNRFKTVIPEDIENIKSYFKRVEQFVKEYTAYHEHYDFNLSQIKEGDYCYIDSKEGQPIGTGVYEKYDNYNVYYIDMEKQILYFIHNNI